MNKLLVGGLSIVLVGLIGFIVVHMVGGLVSILGLIMANPIHTIIFCLFCIGVIASLPSKKQTGKSTSPRHHLDITVTVQFPTGLVMCYIFAIPIFIFLMIFRYIVIYIYILYIIQLPTHHSYYSLYRPYYRFSYRGNWDTMAKLKKKNSKIFAIQGLKEPPCQLNYPQIDV